jgi:photosystem II stability/assembly factor-like uncharacterized protein
MKRLVFLLFLFCTIAWAHTFHGAAMAPNTLKGWVVRNDTGCVYYTPDCGLTWIDRSFFTSRYFSDIFFLNEQKGWLCSDQGFVYHTENGGTNWNNQVFGLSKQSFRVIFLNDSCGWVGCSDGLEGLTIDGGQDWQQILLPFPPFHCDTIEVWGILFVDRQKGWFCAGNYPVYWEPDTWFTKGQGYIAKSINGGFNWQLLRRDTIYDFFDIKMLDTLNGFVVGGNDRTMSATVMKTQDGGVTWQPLTIPAQAKYLRSLDFVGNHAWAVGHNGTIIQSSNGGNTWTMQSSNVNTTLYDVDFSDTLHGLVAGDSYVLYTHDGGNTWNIANMGIEEESSTFNTIHSILEVYPNPAKFLTAIRYSLLSESKVSLLLYDISGRLVKTLVNENKKSGNYNITLSTKTLAAGVYFLFLQTESKRIIERIVLVK